MLLRKRFYEIFSNFISKIFFSESSFVNVLLVKSVKTIRGNLVKKKNGSLKRIRNVLRCVAVGNKIKIKRKTPINVKNPSDSRINENPMLYLEPILKNRSSEFLLHFI